MAAESTDELIESLGVCLHRFCMSGEMNFVIDDTTSVSAVIDRWIEQKVRVLSIFSGNDEERAALGHLGLASAFEAYVLNRASMAIIEADSGMSVTSPALSKALADIRCQRVKDCIAFIEEKAKVLLCPFSGESRKTMKIAGAHVFVHSEAGRSCFILPDSPLDCPGGDRVWFFPQEQTLLVYGARYDISFFRQAIEFLIVNQAAISEFNADKAPKKLMLFEEATLHVGHYTWNVVSGWEDIFLRSKKENVDFIASYEGWRVFGGVACLYREEACPNTIFLTAKDVVHRFHLMIEHRALGFVVKGREIRDGLAERIQAYCTARLSDEFNERLSAFRNRYFPLVMLTVRTGNRSWVEQGSGYTSLINALVNHFPSIGFVFDGLNSGLELSHVQMDIDTEVSLVGAIKREVDCERIIDSIGCPVEEGIALASAIDFFVAPLGAGLAKSRWIANKQGLIFSNEICLDENSYDGRLYSDWRDGLVDVFYLEKDKVRDVDDGHLGQVMRANFSMRWQDLFEAVLPRLQTIARLERDH